ncbi:hypothetical protein [Bacillus mycoides]|uniref:hypothetical protein n=1 Tax=Bacillus mycoides TaxID=1405 RepID=UPI002DF8FFAA|nr:hypothetical protein [Bacillus mycoides]MEC5265789.1 hypothetical protein [Bacillus mycoides]
MIKRGKYGFYKGSDYRIVETNDGVELISTNEIDLLQGFIRDDWDENMFCKNVSKDDLELAYYITPYVLYKGRKFGIAAGDGSTDSVIIGTTYKSEADELGMKNVNKSEYEMSVNLKDVVLIEEKKTIWGFTLDTDN